MLFSSLPPPAYYQGFLCQKQLIRKAGGSFFRLWDGKSDGTPGQRGQLLWEANRTFVLAAVLLMLQAQLLRVSRVGCCLATCKLKRLGEHGFNNLLSPNETAHFRIDFFFSFDQLAAGSRNGQKEKAPDRHTQTLTQSAASLLEFATVRIQGHF